MNIITNQDIPELFNVAMIVSRFNQEVTQALYEGAFIRLQELGFNEDQITIVWVPGAVEIPLTAQRLALSKRFDAIICLGAVIRGQTSHYDYVCEQVSSGCMRVMLDHQLPVIFGVLTTENEEQAFARVGGDHGHKGREAVEAAMEMVSVLRQL